MSHFVYVALAVLLVSHAAQAQKTAVAVASAGSLRHRNKCTRPDPPVATVGWAIFPGEGTCLEACYNYGLFPITAIGALPPGSPGSTLCRFSYTATDGVTSTIYGTFVEDDDEGPICVGRSAVDGDVFAPSDSRFTCGCCGTINRKGRRYSTGCNVVTAFIPVGGTCPADRSWTSPAGDQICTVTPLLPGATPFFGTYVPATGTCLVEGAPIGTIQRLCYRINPYSGPPAPDCRRP